MWRRSLVKWRQLPALFFCIQMSVFLPHCEPPQWLQCWVATHSFRRQSKHSSRNGRIKKCCWGTLKNEDEWWIVVVQYICRWKDRSSPFWLVSPQRKTHLPKPGCKSCCKAKTSCASRCWGAAAGQISYMVLCQCGNIFSPCNPQWHASTVPGLMGGSWLPTSNLKLHKGFFGWLPKGSAKIESFLKTSRYQTPNERFQNWKENRQPGLTNLKN